MHPPVAAWPPHLVTMRSTTLSCRVCQAGVVSATMRSSCPPSRHTGIRKRRSLTAVVGTSWTDCASTRVVTFQFSSLPCSMPFFSERFWTVELNIYYSAGTGGVSWVPFPPPMTTEESSGQGYARLGIRWQTH